MNTELKTMLNKLAHNRSIAFCYSCYKQAPNGKCNTCGSDDLMRELPGVGVEYGYDWIIQSILETELKPVDLESAFEEMVRECYPETTQVGWLELDTVSVLKEMDPVSWRCALSDWESHEAEEGSIISFDGGSTYYWTSCVEALIDNK